MIVFAAVSLCCAAGAVSYVLDARQRTQLRDTASGGEGGASSEQLSRIQRRPHLLFRSTAQDSSYGRVAVVSLDGLGGPRYVTALNCERVYGSREGGVCLQASRGVFTSYRAVNFDRAFKPLHTFTLAGTPSRVRVSRNGRFAASTVFVAGDSYNSGGFSTRTSLIDLSTAQLVDSLEAFTVVKDGRPFRRVDFNFWGATFAPDGERFFVTLGTGGSVYLVEGETSKRTMQVVRDGVECPSLSPDGSQIAFKSRTIENGRLIWNLRVMNLSSGVETLLSERRNVDDQPEWMDSDNVLYSIPRNVPGRATSDIWIARADGTEQPRIFLSEASSPCVIRP